ncbi:MAG TPA: alanine racemase [Acidimicrobiales bacterium]|nr:alanine racemase [Acidimicrobiales bacterium]HVB71043.1 alanine racemase [Acidimicrobiales bacterium]
MTSSDFAGPTVNDRVRRRLVASVLTSRAEPPARSDIPTPALVLAVDLLDENVERMMKLARAGSVALRPHVKSHKSAFVARRQLEAGAVGLACAKLAEAEAVVAGLIDDGYHLRASILITSPLVGPVLAARAAELARSCDLTVVVDHPDGVGEFAHALVRVGTRASALCDVDVGLERTGVVDVPHALLVVERIADADGLDFGGVQGYAGHLQHIRGRAERREANLLAMARLGEVVDALDAAGLAVSVVTGGGTGTTGLDLEAGRLNELQPGSYVFMDREYSDTLGEDPEGRFHQSLNIDTTVVSANHEGFVTVDAGIKSMATDAGAPRVLGPDGGTYRFFGDEHGLVTCDPRHPLRRGQRLSLVPPHCDPTVDRYDHIWLVRGDDVIGVAEVTARGASQ